LTITERHGNREKHNINRLHRASDPAEFGRDLAEGMRGGPMQWPASNFMKRSSKSI
jgi:hypothetical protein